jgi:hypothetical protein
MSFFKKAEPPVEAPKGGGLAVLRGRARALVRTPLGYAWLRDALQYGDVEAFLAGGPLPAAKIPLLISYLDMRATYDAERDLLVSTAPEPTPAYRGVPAPYEAKPFAPATQAIGPGCYPPLLCPRAEGADKPASGRPKPSGWA